MSSSTTTAEHSTRPHTKWGFAVLFGIVGAVIVGIVVLAFVWPIATASAKNLPIAISGPSASVSAVEKAVDANASGVIDFRHVSGQDAAVAKIEDRSVYGAIILPSTPGTSPTVLTASAGSTVVTNLLTGVATQLQAQLVQQVSAAGGDASKAKVVVTDIVPLASTDKTGSGLIAASFPLVLGGILGGVLVSFLVVGVLRRLLALVVYGLAAGIVVALVLQTWFNILQGSFVINAAALGLAMLATSAVIAGFNSLIGTRGIAVGSVITMLIGNPISAASLPLQFLAGPWGSIGQYFVPGAASALVRELSYFPEADLARYWLTLAIWAVAGMILSVAGHFRSRPNLVLPAAELEPEVAVVPHHPAHVAV
jgi:hypothetical protein